jgi:hypothetical protein
MVLMLATGITTFAADTPEVSLTAVSGYSGHAFVYAQVRDSGSTSPAPIGGSDTRYYSVWKAYSVYAPQCPWLWAVSVYDRTTGRQINVPPPGTPGPNFQTTTVFCPTPQKTPIGTPTVDLAKTRLDLDLRVMVSPNPAQAGQTVTLTTALAAAFRQDLGLYLNVAIIDWRIEGWHIDFGDGTVVQIATHATSLTQSHTYRTVGVYDPLVTASVSGTAQAASFDLSGRPRLFRRQFAVEVGNGLPVLVGPGSKRRYLAPEVAIGVTPTVHGEAAPRVTLGLRHVEVPRGRLVDFYLMPIVIREGSLIVDGARTGSAHSTMVAWQFAGPAGGGPSGQATVPLTWNRPVDPLRLQWNAPDAIVAGQPHDYRVAVTLLINTHFSDGHQQRFSIPSGFDVSVRYSAQQG